MKKSESRNESETRRAECLKHSHFQPLEFVSDLVLGVSCSLVLALLAGCVPSPVSRSTDPQTTFAPASSYAPASPYGSQGNSNGASTTVTTRYIDPNAMPGGAGRRRSGAAICRRAQANGPQPAHLPDQCPARVPCRDRTSRRTTCRAARPGRRRATRVPRRRSRPLSYLSRTRNRMTMTRNGTFPTWRPTTLGRSSKRRWVGDPTRSSPRSPTTRARPCIVKRSTKRRPRSSTPPRGAGPNRRWKRTPCSSWLSHTSSRTTTARPRTRIRTS